MIEINGYDVRIELVQIIRNVEQMEERQILNDNLSSMDCIQEEIHKLKDNGYLSLNVSFYLERTIFEDSVLIYEIEHAENIIWNNEQFMSITEILTDGIYKMLRVRYGMHDESFMIEDITITGLLNKYDISIDLSNPVNILIGANGVGKTSIIRLIDNYCNMNLVDLLRVPFKTIEYKYIADIRKPENIYNNIHERINRDQLLPDVNYFKHRYEEELPLKPRLDDSMYSALLFGTNEEKHTNFKKFIEILLEKDYYSQFIMDLYLNKEWTGEISSLVKKLTLEDAVRKCNIVEVNNKKRFNDKKHFKHSPIANDLLYRSMDEFFPEQWYVIYVDFVNNVIINTNKIHDSSWQSEDIEWAIDSREEPDYIMEFNRWWQPGVFHTPINTIRNYTHTLTLLSTARPRLHNKVYKSKKLFKEYATTTYTEDNIINLELPQNNKKNHNDDVIDISILNVLKEKGVMNINSLLYENYCNIDEIVKINNCAIKYVKQYFSKTETIPNEDWLSMLEKYHIAKVNLESLEKEYKEFVKPLLVKNSFFYINYDMLFSTEFYDAYDHAYCYINLVGEEEKNEYLSKRNSKKELEIIWKDICYLDSLCAYISDVITMCSKTEKNEKIVKYEEMLKRYLTNRKIEVKPSGLCLMEEETDNSVTNELNLANISSGERKIITLFALDIFYKNLLLLLDEPELSLSIIWQEMLLPDLIKNKENRFIVATHSPYLAKGNELGNYIHYLP